MRKHALLAAMALLALIVAVSLVAVGCGDKVPTGAIAKVGDGLVTKEQFNDIIEQAKAQAKQAGQAEFPKAGTAAYNQYASQVVDYLVTQELLNQAAAEFGIEVTEKQIKERVDQLTEAYGGKEAVKELLKQQGLTYEDLDDIMRDQILSQKVYDRVIKSAKVTDKEIAAYYEKNKDQYDQSEVRVVRHVLVKTKAQAEQVRSLLVADSSAANWKKVAKQYSEDPGTKDNGGDLGDVQQGMMVPAFDKAAFSLKKGVVSQPVKTTYGWHILEVTKITPAKASSLEDVKAEIQQTLLGEKQQKVWEKWLKQQQKDAGIVYAPGFDPQELLKATASPEPTVSPEDTASPSESPSPAADE